MLSFIHTSSVWVTSSNIWTSFIDVQHMTTRHAVVVVETRNENIDKSVVIWRHLYFRHRIAKYRFVGSRTIWHCPDWGVPGAPRCPRRIWGISIIILTPMKFWKDPFSYPLGNCHFYLISYNFQFKVQKYKYKYQYINVEWSVFKPKGTRMEKTLPPPCHPSASPRRWGATPVAYLGEPQWNLDSRVHTPMKISNSSRLGCTPMKISLAGRMEVNPVGNFAFRVHPGGIF